MKFSDVMSKTREQLLAWLQQNDPNGAYTDKNVREEFGEHAPLATLDQAREEVFWTLTQNTDYAKGGSAVSFDQLVAAYIRTAVDEIGTGIRSGHIPKKVGLFSDLHDHVDANLYGGSALLANLYGLDDTATDVANLGNTAVGLWLKAGHINSEHPEY